MGKKKVTAAIFFVYLILLVWLVLFKLSFDISELSRMRSINLIPFRGSGLTQTRVGIKEVLYNVIVFVPFGVYLSMWKPEWKILKRVGSILAVSFLFEVLQFVFAIGVSDITDLLGNTLGGIIGIGILAVLQKLLRTKTAFVINLLAAIVMALVLGFYIFLTVVNL